jgi:hypothetical protein
MTPPRAALDGARLEVPSVTGATLRSAEPFSRMLGDSADPGRTGDLAFVIMQIGNDELDRVYDHAIVPALRRCTLEPRRADRHTRGGLLHSEIIGFLESSEILVADLTHERPNCYLEVGYALGIGRFTNLVLMAREDHHPDHPSHQPRGPKVHFDLSGYDILFWSPHRLADLRFELEKRVRRRQLLLREP